MKQVRSLLPIFAFLLFSTTMMFAQNYGDATDDGGMSTTVIFGLLELPFLMVCIYYSFKTAAALKGGVFGKGMNYLAWGFLVMAVGHLAMQVTHIFKYDVFRDPFGDTVGTTLWFVALIITWGLSAYGFYQIYNVSKKG